MVLVTEGWKNGPTSKRELKKPAKNTKSHFLISTYWIIRAVHVVLRDIGSSIVKYFWRIFSKPEPKSLKGKVCLVTGAGRGLGREFCLALAREGAVIACVDINEPNNRTTAAMVKELGAKAEAYMVNVAIKNDVEELVFKIGRNLGPVYLLINNAALIYLKDTVDEEFIRASFNVNVFGPIWMMNAVLPTMELRNEGHIVNISSISSKYFESHMDVYGATKVSLSYMSNCLRSKLLLKDQKNVFVTTIYPNLINTSEDYLRMTTLKVNLVMEMEEVVKATMDAIHYNYEEVIIPSILKYPFLFISEVMPTRTTVSLTKLLCEKVNLPNEDQEKNLPWNDLIKKCSFVENKNER